MIRNLPFLICLVLLISCKRGAQKSAVGSIANEELVINSMLNNRYLASALHEGYDFYDDHVKCDTSKIELFLKAEKKFFAGYDYRYRLIKSLLKKVKGPSDFVPDKKLRLMSLSIDSIDFGSESMRMTPKKFQNEISSWRTNQQDSVLQSIYNLDQLNTTILIEFYTVRVRPYYFCDYSE